jgi:hypothetical protein
LAKGKRQSHNYVANSSLYTFLTLPTGYLTADNPLHLEIRVDRVGRQRSADDSADDVERAVRGGNDFVTRP